VDHFTGGTPVINSDTFWLKEKTISIDNILDNSVPPKRLTYPAAAGWSMMAGSDGDSEPAWQLAAIPEGLTTHNFDKVNCLGDDTAQKLSQFFYDLGTTYSEMIKHAAENDFGFDTKPSDEMIAWHAPKPILIVLGDKVLSNATFQVMRLGNVLNVAVPGELTTMAGRRIKSSIRGVAKDSLSMPNCEVVLTCYANGHCSYITTKEEYDTQSYEGASNFYGPNTLEALIIEYERLMVS